MPDEYDDAPQEESSVIKELRAQAAKATEAERRAEVAEQRAKDLERHTAFKDAGLDPKNKLHAMAINNYEGDLEDALLAQYVTDLGLIPTATPQSVPQAEQQAFQQVSQQQAGGDMTPPPPNDAQQMEQFWKSLPEGSDKGQALSQWLEQRGEAVSWAGPQSEVMPWDQASR